MEAATFYRAVAEFPGVRSLLVKGVSDYAESKKDDSDHEYAAAVAATYILSFVKEYVTLDRIPGLYAEKTMQLRAFSFLYLIAMLTSQITEQLSQWRR